MCLKRNFALNEWSRIKRRCNNARDIKASKNNFISKMIMNGYPSNLIKKWIKSSKNGASHNGRIEQEIFYLSVPFINDGINKLLKKSLSHLGLKIRLSHKSQRLISWLKPNFKKLNNKCSLANCKLNNKACSRTMVVYQCKCTCGATYIGSTERQLHIRIKEHYSLHSSALFQHRLLCNGTLSTTILSNSRDLTDLRLREAILINSLHPSLNRKEEVQPFHLVV
jgi:hypothetical protein